MQMPDLNVITWWVQLCQRSANVVFPKNPAAYGQHLSTFSSLTDYSVRLVQRTASLLPSNPWNVSSDLWGDQESTHWKAMARHRGTRRTSLEVAFVYMSADTEEHMKACHWQLESATWHVWPDLFRTFNTYARRHSNKVPFDRFFFFSPQVRSTFQHCNYFWVVPILEILQN